MIKQAGIVTAAIVLLSFPAWGGNKGGLSYTSRGGASPVEQSGDNGMRTLTYPSASKDALPEDPNAPPVLPGAEAEEPATPTSRVWKKYKSLASGTAEAPPADPEAIEKEVLPEGSEPPKEAPPVGIAAIIQQYQDNKKARSSMKTLVVSRPQAPKEPEKPEVEEPAKTEDAKETD